MNKAQLHLTNFLLLVEEAGSLTKLARACGYETPLLYLSSNAVWNNKQAMSLHAASSEPGCEVGIRHAQTQRLAEP